MPQNKGKRKAWEYSSVKGRMKKKRRWGREEKGMRVGRVLKSRMEEEKVRK